MNNFKNVLKEADRYESVLSLLTTIEQFKDNSDSSYPVQLFHSYDGRYKYRVTGENLKSQAGLIIEIIQDEIDLYDVHAENLNFEDISQYVDSYSNMLLHNYSVTLSHGNIPEKGSMNTIRIWEILHSLIWAIITYDDDWDIPDGWKIKED